MRSKKTTNYTSLLCWFHWFATFISHRTIVKHLAVVGQIDSGGKKNENPKKIAIIGGGVSGSFVTKYLVDYDTSCQKIDSITIFEPYPVEDPLKTPSTNDNEDTTEKNQKEQLQGSRVASLQLQDGSMIELGASIGYKGFYHVISMIQGDDDLEMIKPFSTGESEDTSDANKKQQKQEKDKIPEGMALYSGNGIWPLITAGVSPFLKHVQLTLRYNWDLYKVSHVCKNFLHKWEKLPGLLESVDADTFYKSPDEIWQALGMYQAVHSSFDQLLDRLGISSADPPWYRKLLPYQGSLRSELLTAINLVNYNQNNANVNGIVGMGSFAASLGGLFSISGERNDTIRHVKKHVTTVLGGLEGFTLYSDQEVMGDYDLVVLAAPIQQSKISFLIQSHIDPAVIQQMPLGGLVDGHDEKVHHAGGRESLPLPLPGSSVRQYKQVTTTILRDANLSIDFMSYPETYDMPRSVLMTNEGKHEMHNITVITFIKKGVYKIFSDSPLDPATLTRLFGPDHKVEYVKLWGGRHGGATPDYQGQGKSPSFLLYDGAAGLEGHTNSGALYYPTAMEQSSLASMEVAAVGAKAVAKLIAQRIGMIAPVANEINDEL